ncbi:BQ5605_C012g06829 [Microbotryum silenes-dioicae]|uniref:BQ5605_C012g06829 protein n=1 Tax=Microbotryum silenes-dioicae TaxID=796604 RepID=A0A2X0MLN2_9BASI|nr:BQ5605_C012g06829 [Microbotryum silenes-dioicae]
MLVILRACVSTVALSIISFHLEVYWVRVIHALAIFLLQPLDHESASIFRLTWHIWAFTTRQTAFLGALGLLNTSTSWSICPAVACFTLHASAAFRRFRASLFNSRSRAAVSTPGLTCRHRPHVPSAIRASPIHDALVRNLDLVATDCPAHQHSTMVDKFPLVSVVQHNPS